MSLTLCIIQDSNTKPSLKAKQRPVTILETTCFMQMDISQRKRAKENVMPMRIACLYLTPHLVGARIINLAPSYELSKNPPPLSENLLMMWMVNKHRKDLGFTSIYH